MSTEPTPILKLEAIRREAVALLRQLATNLESGSRTEAAEALLRLNGALRKLERWRRLLFRRERGPGAV